MANDPENRKPQGTRRLLRRLARLLVLGLGVFALATGALLVRLWRGPVPLDFLTPRLVSALQPEDTSYAVRIGATLLVWAGHSRGIDLVVNDVAFTERGGAPIAALREIAVHLSLPALLQGSIAPRKIDLFSPEIRLIREPDGSIGLGLGGAASETGGTSILDGFSGEPGASGEAPASAWLHRIVVRDGRLSLTDRQSGFQTDVVDLQADVSRADDALAIAVSGALALGPRRLPVRVDATRPEQAAPTEIAISVPDLDLPALVEATSGLLASASPSAVSVADAAARLGMPLDVKIDLTFAETRWSAARIRARGERGTLAMSPLLPGPVAVAGLDLDASLNASPSSPDAPGNASVERAALDFHLDLGGPALKIAGSWTRADGAVSVDADVKQLPVSAIGAYWPASAAATARTWVTDNITAGDVRAASASLAGVAKIGDEPGFVLQKLDGRIEYVGLAVRYVDTMPPARGVAGSATFSDEAWSFAVRSGNVAGLDVPGAAVDITGLTAPVTRIAIDARARGPLRDALLLVDHEPLRFAKRAGIDPAGTSGSITGRLQLAFPLAGAPVPSDLGAAVQVDLRRAALPKAIGDYSVSDGDLRLDVRASTLDLSGTARIENAPCEVRWKEDLGKARGISRTVDVKGTVDAAERSALGFDLRPWLTGPVAVTAHVEQSEDGSGTAQVAVDLTPATIAVAELRLTKARGAPGSASGRLAVARGRIIAVEAFRLEAAGAHARGRATLESGRFGAIDLAGELPAATAGGERPDFSLTVTSEGSNGHVVFASEDASALLKLILPDATVSGGALRFTGRTSPARRPGLDLAGSFTVERFNLTESSLLTRLATLASLPGIVSALRSQGIAFDRLSSDLEYAAGKTTFERAILTGPSLRLLFGGSVDGPNDRIAIDGTLVPPLYGLNALPGKIPVIGKLFRSGDGGLVGIDFTVRGDVKDPKISVKPLSSLTPGVLKSLTSEPARK